MNSPLILPDPGCSFGYPLGQVREILGGKANDFWWWMRKRPMGFCDGPAECERAHSFVVYPADLARFLQQAAA